METVIGGYKKGFFRRVADREGELSRLPPAISLVLMSSLDPLVPPFDGFS